MSILRRYYARLACVVMVLIMIAVRAEDYTNSNIDFLAGHAVDPALYETVTCIGEDIPLFEEHDLEDACGRWIANASMLGCCVQLMAVGHCLSHTDGLYKASGEQELYYQDYKDAVLALMDTMYEIGKSTDDILESVEKVSNHGPVQNQIEGEFAYSARDVIQAEINAIANRMYWEYDHY